MFDPVNIRSAEFITENARGSGSALEKGRQPVNEELEKLNFKGLQFFVLRSVPRRALSREWPSVRDAPPRAPARSLRRAPSYRGRRCGKSYWPRSNPFGSSAWNHGCPKWLG